MTRVFCDKLDIYDRDFFHSQMRQAMETHLGVDILTLEEIVFGDFSRNRGDTEYSEHHPSHVKNLLKVRSHNCKQAQLIIVLDYC